MDVVDRGEAAQRIAKAIEDRKHYIIPVAEEALSTTPEWFKRLPTWTCYIDNGIQPVIVLDQEAGPVALAALASLLPSAPAVVLTVPKSSTTPQRLGRLFGVDKVSEQEDLLLLFYEDNQVFMPTLYLDAIEINSPATAAQMRAAIKGAV